MRKLQKKAAAVGFDWVSIVDVFAKVAEEIAELQEVLETVGSEGESKRREEFGDLIFAVVNLSRFLKVDPEEALALTNQKFSDRFHYIEQNLRLKGQKMDKTGIDELEFYWQEAKNVGKREK